MKTIVLILVMIFATISLVSTVGLFWALDQRATGFEEGYRMGQFDASMGKYKYFDAWWNVSATTIGIPDMSAHEQYVAEVDKMVEDAINEAVRRRNELAGTN